MKADEDGTSKFLIGGVTGGIISLLLLTITIVVIFVALKVRNHCRKESAMSGKGVLNFDS